MRPTAASSTSHRRMPAARRGARRVCARSRSSAVTNGPPFCRQAEPRRARHRRPQRDAPQMQCGAAGAATAGTGPAAAPLPGCRAVVNPQGQRNRAIPSSPAPSSSIDRLSTDVVARTTTRGRPTLAATCLLPGRPARGPRARGPRCMRIDAPCMLLRTRSDDRGSPVWNNWTWGLRPVLFCRRRRRRRPVVRRGWNPEEAEKSSAQGWIASRQLSHATLGQQRGPPAGDQPRPSLVERTGRGSPARH
jgi:hypothetical protein